MKLLTLLAILVVILVFYLLFYKTLDYFTPNPYVLSWNAPTNNGGDPNCCGYDWQICTDATCKTIVDSGTTTKTSAETTKLSWATSYTVQVRATNVAGSGAWTSANLSTGDGTVSSVAIGSAISEDGIVTSPLSAGPAQNIAVWTSLSAGSVSPNTLVGYAQIIITRGGKAQPAIVMELVSGNKGAVNTFEGDILSANGQTVLINQGDVITVVVSIFTSAQQIVTEATASVTVTTTVPGNPTGLALTYGGTPPPLSPNVALVYQGLGYVKSGQYSKLQQMLYTAGSQQPIPWIVQQIKSDPIIGLRLMVLFCIMQQFMNQADFPSQLKLWAAPAQGDITTQQLVQACEDIVSGEMTPVYAVLTPAQQITIRGWITSPP